MPEPRIVLTFHGIGEPPSYADPVEVPYWVSRESFADFAARAAARDDIDLTFDDGYISDLREALPVLVRHQLKASFAISVRCIGQRGYLDRSGIRELVDAGMDIMSHGVEHRPWTELENTELTRQALDSRSTLEEISGTPVNAAACPFGAYDARVLTTLRQAGYTRVYTSDKGVWNGFEGVVPRNTIKSNDTFDEVVARARTCYSGLRGVLKRVRSGAKRWASVG